MGELTATKVREELAVTGVASFVFRVPGPLLEGVLADAVVPRPLNPTFFWGCVILYIEGTRHKVRYPQKSGKV